jgi:hypothetical protein
LSFKLLSTFSSISRRPTSRVSFCPESEGGGHITLPILTVLARPASINSVGVSSPFAPPHSQVNGIPNPGVPVGGINITQVENTSGQPKKIYKIKSQFEGRTEHKSFGQQNNVPSHDTGLTESQHSESHHDRMPLAPAPPPPPMQFQDQDLISPRMQIKAPPPPP